MQVLFVHPNFPAQFGHIASRLVTERGIEAVFVTRAADAHHDGIGVIRYDVKGGATRANHHCSRTFENAVWHAHGVYEACKAAKLAPDLVVGHSGFGSTVFLQELYRAPIVSYFEYYYHAHGSDMDYRPEFPPEEIDFLRAHARNAMILLDLAACAAGYAPTEWQKSLLPREWHPKIEVIHDGVDTTAWRRQPGPRRIGLETIPDDVRIVTYVARGLEAMRGFDVFVRVAKRIMAQMRNVLFVVVGGDRIHYGNDLRHVKAKTFREHVLATERPDPGRFRFLGTVPGPDLARIFSMSDLHVYLTVPFVPSWSLLDALACECVVLASDVAPVREIVRHGENGLTASFFDEDALAAEAVRVLKDPPAFRPLAEAGRSTVESRYSVDVTLPRLWALFERVLAAW